MAAFSSFINRRMADHCFGVAACPFPTDLEINLDGKSIAFDAAAWDAVSNWSETQNNGAVVTDPSVSGIAPTTVIVSGDFGGYGRQDIVSWTISGLTGDYGVGSEITFADAALQAILSGDSLIPDPPSFPQNGTSKPVINSILSHIFGVASYTLPTTLDLAFVEHEPTFGNPIDWVTPSYVEFAGSGYSRIATAGSWGASTQIGVSSSWLIRTNADVSYTVGSGWTTTNFVPVLVDALGSLMHLVQTQIIGTAAGDTVIYDAGSLAFRFGL